MDLARNALTMRGEQIHIADWPTVSALTHNPHSGIFDDVSEAAARHHALAGLTFVINVQSRIDEDTLEKVGLVDRAAATTATLNRPAFAGDSNL
ncbi:MAG TPA: hypothetical protein VFC03_04920 [Acidimicrobiales bacterium]|nr:hypothetical protein [Acidimicrobiales bacterium]